MCVCVCVYITFLFACCWKTFLELKTIFIYLFIYLSVYLFIHLYKDAALSAHTCTVELRTEWIHSGQPQDIPVQPVSGPSPIPETALLRCKLVNCNTTTFGFTEGNYLIRLGVYSYIHSHYNFHTNVS